MKKVLKILIMSSMICFFTTFVVIVINAIMGIVVGLDYYFMMAGLLTLGLTSGLILFDARKIFSKKKKISRKPVSNRVIKPTKQHTSTTRRRKIS